MDDKTQDLLLQLLQDIAVIKSKLDTIEEIKIEAKSLNNRVDQLEAQNREHDKTIKSLENRASTMEQFTRNNMADAKKQQTGGFISMGLAIFSSVISIVIGLLIK
jgi:hypothetical protein